MNPATAQRVVLHASSHPEDVAKAVAAGGVLVRKMPEVDVQVIVNGAALDGILQQAEAVRLVPGVRVSACALGMAKRGLQPELLQEGIGTVDSAVVALARAQLDGAAYIRI